MARNHTAQNLNLPPSLRAGLPFLALAICCFSHVAVAAENVESRDHTQEVLTDQPVLYLKFDGAQPLANLAKSDKDAPLKVTDVRSKLAQPGPRTPNYPDFAEGNQSVWLHGMRSYLAVKDPGDASPLDFEQGDAITIEAWVQPTSIDPGRNIYIIGKGRTGNPGFNASNQNWALRLRGDNGVACVSFLFRDVKNAGDENWHRWTTTEGFYPDGAWHHVAVSYKFGEPESVRGYIDGKQLKGSWDMGGSTTQAPVVDNDDVWIGSALKAGQGNSFQGCLDEVALYRSIVPAERLESRFRFNPPESTVEKIEVPADLVLVELLENIPPRGWDAPPSTQPDIYTQRSLGFHDVPRKYEEGGLISDRSQAFLLRAHADINLPAGEHQFLLRAFNGARLYVDNKLLAQTGFRSTGGSAHGEVPELEESPDPLLVDVPVAHQQRLATVTLKEGTHRIRLEAVIGGANLRPDVGQLFVALADKDGHFQLVGPQEGRPLTAAGWDAYRAELGAYLNRLNAERRSVAGRDATEYWNRRHAIARQLWDGRPQTPVPALPDGKQYQQAVNNQIDRYIVDRLAAAGTKPTPLTSDEAFLRRLSLDLRGITPTLEEIESFAKDRRANKRELAIQQMLESPDWAHRWVGYWQDVLAENPGILKPTLNNTGPFRWWILESLQDNKPMDRFVTELVMMEGSKYDGGPAGFSLATQNDVPMAAKAGVLGTAFLGIEMKCARCHDAPFHPYLQRDLFSVAAMLDRGSQKVPKSSTVPMVEGGRKPLVEVTLKPGTAVPQEWPFAELLGVQPGELPAGVLLNADDSRAQLAALITSPTNERFPQVLVNRLWKKLLGWGLVEPVHDWDAKHPSHPQLLEYLGRELVTHNYDMKHVAALICASHVYQRQPLGDADLPPENDERLFAGPARRRMSAEQLLDSLFVAAGKPLRCEPLNMDVDGRRAAKDFMNLGVPQRAWEFTSLSNERDRPSLAMPRAQSFVDLLTTFGWRETRQDPQSVRDDSPTMLQPLTLSNGVVGHRAVTLSADHVVTAMCLEEKIALPELVRRIYLQVLTREPSGSELAASSELLSEGFAERIVAPAKSPHETVSKNKQNAVSWSNHLSAEANRLKLEMEKAVRAGDPPSERLATDWRERAEDLLWALVNSPEFLYLP